MPRSQNDVRPCDQFADFDHLGDNAPFGSTMVRRISGNDFSFVSGEAFVPGCEPQYGSGRNRVGIQMILPPYLIAQSTVYGVMPPPVLFSTRPP